MADEPIKTRLLNGEEIKLDSSDPITSRVIEASWIRDAVVATKNIFVEHAIIRGVLNMKYQECQGELVLRHCVIEEEPFFAFSTFHKNIDFTGSEFKKGANFQGAAINKDSIFENSRLVDGRFNFTDAVIRGRLECSASFGPKLSATFEDAHFLRKAVFNGSTFNGPANFAGAVFDSDLEFTGVSFLAGSDFSGVRVKGNLCFKPASTQPQGQVKFKGHTTFYSMIVDGTCRLERVIFEEPGSFKQAVIAKDACFHSVHFQKEVDFFGARFGPSEFYGLICDGRADFSGSVFDGDVSYGSDAQKGLPAAVFNGNADFTGTEIRGQFSFQSVHVKGNTSFNGAVIQLDGYFNREAPTDFPCIFEGETDFIGIHIGGVTLFDNAEFRQKTIFKTARFDEGTHFHNCKFSAEADFTGTRVSDNLYFIGAVFSEARFDRCHFEHEVHFGSVECKGKSSFDDCEFGALASFSPEAGSPTTQLNEATFARSQFAGDARFGGCQFTGAASFANTSFRAVSFATEGHQFQANINLAGCKYDQIKTAWENMFFFPDSAGKFVKFLRHARLATYRPEARLSPYDRQAFMQLESAFRKAGADEEANRVFLKRRLSEQREKFRKEEWLSLLGDLLYGWLAHFGVRPLRLLVWATLLIALGTFVFSRPNTIVPSDTRIPLSASVQLSKWESFGVSLHQFLPIDVPMGSEWKPAKDPRKIEIAPVKFPALSKDIRPSYFATIALRIPGWMLVPLGVASLTGLLKRSISP